MSNFPTTKYRAQDANGTAISGAALYFYEAGTSTPLATYSDEDLTSANANPVIADSGGWFGEIYMTPEVAYKVVLQDAAGGSTVWETDDVYASMLSSSALATRVAQIASTPLDFGAVGDGAADEASAVQAAVDAASAVVDLLGKTFRCDSAITLRSGVELRNGTLDFSSSSLLYYAVVAEGSIGSSENLTADADIGDTSITYTNNLGIVAGDIALVASSASFGLGRVGEIVKMSAWNGLHGPIEGNYAVADTAYIRKITPVEDVRIRDVEIIGNGTIDGAIKLGLCHRARVESVRGYNMSGAALVVVDTCLETHIENCAADYMATGVYLRGTTTTTTIKGCRIDSELSNSELVASTRVSLYSASGVRGPVRGLFVESCTVSGAQLANLSDNILGAIISGCVANTSTANAIYCAGIDIKITNNVLRTAVQSSSPVVHIESGCSDSVYDGWSIDISDNTISARGGGGVDIDVSDDPGTISVTNNSIFTPSYYTASGGAYDIEIDIATGGTIKDLNISGNTLRGAMGGGVTIGGLGAIERTRVSDCLVSGFGRNMSGTPYGVYYSLAGDGAVDVSSSTVIAGADDAGIFVETTGPCTVRGNTVTEGSLTPSTEGIAVDKATPATISGNTVTGFALGVHYDLDSGIVTDNGRTMICANNISDCASGIQYTGGITDSEFNVLIADNTIQDATGTAIYVLERVKGALVTGNTITQRFESANYGIYLNGAAVTVAATSVIGNLVYAGGGVGSLTTGIALASCDTDCIVSGNVVRGCTTAYSGNRLSSNSPHRVVRATFNPSVTTIYAGTPVTALGSFVPGGAVVTRSYLHVETTLQSATDAATLSIGTESHAVGAVVASIAINDASNPWDAGWHDGIQDGAVANFTTASGPDGLVEARAAVENITAGKFTVFLEYAILD